MCVDDKDLVTKNAAIVSGQCLSVFALIGSRKLDRISFVSDKRFVCLIGLSAESLVSVFTFV